MISLTATQEAAIDRLMTSPDRTRILTGAAGTGKTTIMEHLMQRLEDSGVSVSLMAPTGAAAARLQERTGRNATTIHSRLYQRAHSVRRGFHNGLELHGDDLKDAQRRGLHLTWTDELVFEAARDITAGRDGVAIIDEGSMISADLASDIDQHSSYRIIVADPYQLPPVNAAPGYDLHKPTAHLTEIMRQGAGSAILRAATAIREGRDWSAHIDGEEVHWCDGIDQTIAWRASGHGGDFDATVVTYKNDDRTAINMGVRAALGYHDLIVAGERLVCLLNNNGAGWMNGELWDVVTACAVRLPRLGDWFRVEIRARHWHPDRPPVVAFVAQQQLSAGLKWHGHLRKLAKQIDSWSASAINALADAMGVARRSSSVAAMPGGDWFVRQVFVADYGYCTTVHKAQGNEWSSVGIAYSNAMNAPRRGRRAAEMRKLWYTAVTRARRQLVIFKI